MDETSLVSKAKKGDGNAFWELLKPRKDRLYRIAYCYVKNEEDAMDIVSETVYKGLTSIHKLKKPEYFQTWIVRILIHCAIDHLKKVTPLMPASDELHEIPDSKEPYRSEILDLYQAVDHLDSKHKSIIILKYIEDMTIPQISDIMKMPVGTVKTYLNRALKKLRVDLEDIS